MNFLNDNQNKNKTFLLTLKRNDNKRLILDFGEIGQTLTSKQCRLDLELLKELLLEYLLHLRGQDRIDLDLKLQNIVCCQGRLIKID